LKSLSKRLSIQYVYERVFLYFCCFDLFLKAGAKVENLFLTGKSFLKFFFRKISFPFYFFIYQSINELSNVLPHLTLI